MSETAGSIAARIDALLPQTQCTRCGYTGCSPYAAAIADGEAQINQCPPGGAATIEALALLLNSERRRVRAARRLDRRNTLHRLRALPRTLSGGCHRRRAEVHAHRGGRSLHGVRTMFAALPG